MRTLFWNARNVHPVDCVFPSALATIVAWLAWNYWIAATSLPLPNIACAPDLGVMVDAGYRFYQGLRTHADYHSPFGPVLGIIFGIPMVVGGPTYSSLRYLPATVTAVVVGWTWLVCGRSLRPASRALAAMAMGAIAGGIYHQGLPPEALTFATFYNRVAFGILGVVGMCSLLPRKEHDPITNSFRDSSMAVGALTLVFLKASFAVAVVPLVLTTLVSHRRTKVEYCVTLITGCLMLTILLGAIGFRIDRMWSDLMLAAQARAQGNAVAYFFFPVRNAMANLDFISLLIISSMLWLPTAGAVGAYWKLAWGAFLLLMPTLTGWGITLIQSHGDGRGISLVLCSLAASCAWLRGDPDHQADELGSAGQSKAEPTVSLVRDRIAASALCLASLLFIIPHAQSLLFLRRISAEKNPPQFRVPAIRDLLIGPYANDQEPDYVGKVNEAINLIKRYCEKDARLQYMGGPNIYSFACGLRSPRDSMLFWCSICTYTTAHHPPTKDFDDTEFILVAKPSLSTSTVPAAWREVYSYCFSTHFTLCEETTFFELYKRKAAEQSDVP